MMNVCAQCGAWDVEKRVIQQGDTLAVAMCGSCGAEHPFIRRPLFVVTGASGAGKSAACSQLVRRQSGLLTLESDILWGAIDASGADGVDRYWNAWLRLVKNINQGQQPVLLCGTVAPETMERQPERRYVGRIHYLALVVAPEIQTERLRGRPDWRESSDPAFIEEHVRFNQWFFDHAGDSNPSWSLLDTTNRQPNAVADAILDWVADIQERSAIRTTSSLS